MRKILLPALLVVLPATMITIGAFLPKYAGMLLFLYLLLLLAGYLWLSAEKRVAGLPRPLRFTITLLYWLPAAALPAGLALSAIIPFTEWTAGLRTWYQNFILVFFVSIALPATALLLADLVRIARYLAGRVISSLRKAWKLIPRNRWLLRTGWVAGALAFLAMTAGTLFGTYDFRVREVSVTLEGLPRSFNGYRVVQLSDIHLGSWTSKPELERAVQMVNALRPDAIFFTGDMFNYVTAEGAGFENILGKLAAPAGVFAIMGNHDYGDYVAWSSPGAKEKNLAAVGDWYRTLGWTLLRNSHAFLVRGTDSIALLGVENWGATRRFQRLGDLGKALQGAENAPVKILLTHDPSHWDSIVSRHYPNIALTLSGHTHGGQIGLEAGRARWSIVQGISSRWGGLYENPAPGAPQYLYVNRGLGTIGYAGRLGILPEITLVVLKAP